MADRYWYRRMLGFGLLGLAAMTLLTPAVMLAWGTTGHDWYAARRLTMEELKLALGFSEFTPVAYRRDHGDVWHIPRAAFVGFGPPVRARQRILSATGDGMMLGAGIGGTVFVLMAFGAAGALRRSSRAAVPAPAVRSWRDGPVVWRGTVERVPGRPGGRARVALLVVPEDDFKELAVPDGVMDIAALPEPGPQVLSRAEAENVSDAASAPPARSSADRLPAPRPAAPVEPAPAGPERSECDAGKADSDAGTAAKPPAAASGDREGSADSDRRGRRDTGAAGKKPRRRIY